MVIIQNTINDNSINEKIINNLAQSVIHTFDKGRSELLIRFVNEHEIKALNKKYRNKKEPTNVLAFTNNLPIKQILGDLIICLSVVKEEAKIQNKTFNEHLMHIVVHGILHLLGYKHDTDKQAQKMEATEIKILAKINIANPYMNT